ncbi:hypothetical protein [Glycomyces sp. MUSA5-2]|uniref:hypothetical protein n=1 Tax=Glycomyces sp. MUSA5-2 TaxID=2053002 RepID=UPI0030090F15
MSTVIIIRLGEGVLRVPAWEGESGRFGSVALVEDDRWVRLTLDRIPKGHRAELVAVKLTEVTIRRWFRRSRTEIEEAPVSLGVGTVFTSQISPATGRESVGVKPDRPAPGPGPWLDLAALKEVEGHRVRLVLVRTPETRAATITRRPEGSW